MTTAMLVRGARTIRGVKAVGLQLGRELPTLLRADVLDREWLEAQTGKTYASTAAATWAYLTAPPILGLSPHPLFEAEFWNAPSNSDRDPLYRFLSHRASRQTTPHPLFDVDAARQQVGQDSSFPWLDWVKLARPETPVPVPSGTRPISWGELRDLLIAAAAEWRQTRVEPIKRQQTVAAIPPSAPAEAPVSGTEDSPLVSVILATWNRASMLRGAIDSVLQQKYRRLELIIVDDGSTDDTVAVVEGAAAFDDRVRLVKLPRSGVSAARNAGIEAAFGEYVAFIDSDNTWEPDFLAVTIPTMRARGWLIGHAALSLEQGGRTMYRATDAGRETLLVANFVDLNVLVASRALAIEIGGFDESLRRAVDYDYILRLSERAAPHLVGVVGARYTESDDDPIRISTAQPVTWNSVVRAKHWSDWPGAESRQRQQGRVSLVVPLNRELRTGLNWLDLVRDQPPGADWELVLAGLGTRAQLGCLRAAARGLPVTLVSRHLDGLATLANAGALASTGAILIFAKPNATFESTLLLDLAGALEDDRVALVQPLNERSDHMVSSAGAYFPPGVVDPSPLLEGLPVEDAMRLRSTAVPAAYSAVVGIRAETFIRVRGFDSLFGNSLAEVDLSLRVAEAGLGETWLIPESRTTVRRQRSVGFPHDMARSARVLAERWSSPPAGSAELVQRAGFVVALHAESKREGTQHPTEITWGRTPVLARPAMTITEHPPRLRWTIDTAAPAGPKGAVWGDRHFAGSLAAALRRHGQDATLDPREARARRTRSLDDVLLTLRGLDEVHPSPGRVNLMWVISHPDEVTPREAARYDAVFAASDSWAASKSLDWGIPVRPLLQCTDPDLFNPQRAEADSGAPVLFVGNARRVARPAVMWAIATGIRVDVYGGGWDTLIPADRVVSDAVANAEVGVLYAGAGVVVNDHWDDMRRSGFLSNRLFDAVASGARVVSDDVPGLSAVFGDAVTVFRSPQDMRRLLLEPYDAHFADREARLATAERFAVDHSFDARAVALLDAALERWGTLDQPGSAVRRPHILTGW